MFTINRKVLASELGLLQTVAERKGTIPILAFVKVECQGDATVLTATDLDATIVSTVESAGEAWSGCVSLRQLYSLIRLMDADLIQFTERANQRIEVKDGDSKHLLPFEPADRFPAFDMPKGLPVRVDAEILARMIGSTSFWVRPYSDDLKANEMKQTGLSVRSNGHEVEVFAFNRTCGAIATLTQETAEFNTIIPKQAAAALKGFSGEVEIVCGENLSAFIAPTRTLVTRHQEGSFPPWRTFLPAEREKIEIPETFKDTVQRVSVTTNSSSGFFEVLKLTLSKDAIKLQSRGGDDGQSEEIVATTSTLNGKSVEIGVNGKHIIEALSAANTNVTCEFLDGAQPLLFLPANKDFELCYLTMPCRLDW